MRRLKKNLKLLAKNLEQAKKKSEELTILKSKKEKEAEAARLELAASVERAKAQELAASEAKALLMDEKKRSDELLASTAKINSKIDSLNKGLDGVGQDLKSVGEGLVGVGDKISTVSQDVSSVKEGVSKVGKNVQESVDVQKENFRKLNERQTRSVNEIFTRYEQNKVTLELTTLTKLESCKPTRKINSLWIPSLWLTENLSMRWCTPRTVHSG